MKQLGITARDLKVVPYEKFVEMHERDSLFVNDLLSEAKQEEANRAKYIKGNKTIYGMYLRVLAKVVETAEKEKKIS
jgi:hypothetical protein